MNRKKSQPGIPLGHKRQAVPTMLVLVLTLVCAITGCQKKKPNEVEAIRKAGTLQVAIVETGSLCTRKEGETLVGLEPDLVKHIAGALNVEPSYQVCSREEALKKLTLGEADIALGCINGANSLTSDYLLSTPYKKGFLYAITKTGDYVLTTGAFKDSSLGIEQSIDQEIRSSFYAAENIRITDYASAQDAARAVKEGTIRAYICHEEQAKALLNDQNLQVQNIANLEPEEYVIVAPKTSQTLIGGINTLIQQFLDPPQDSQTNETPEQ